MRILQATLLALLAVALGDIALAQSQSERHNLDIETQPIKSALRDLGAQTGIQILFRAEDVARANVTTPRIVGEMSPQEGLDRMLEKAPGLQYEWMNSHTVLVAAKERVDAWKVAQASDKREGGGGSSQRGVGGATKSSESGEMGSDDTKLEEVIVTAQKRAERLIDVPISIVALSGSELQQRQLSSLDDLQFAVPGMGVTTDGLGNTIELRGVSNLLGSAALVGVYIDEADVTNSGGSQINANTYDLERVEVLRGPQGTLYGEGSVGGTVRFITKSPVLDRFGMTADVTSLFTQGGSPGERINTAINVPLIDNELAVRIVGTYDREGGWIDQPAAGLKDINGQDLTNVRIRSLWQPSPRFSASFMAQLYRNDRSTGNYEDANGKFTQVFNLTTTPKVSEDHDIYNLTLTYDLPGVKVLSATSYLREKTDAKNVGYTFPLNPAPPLFNTYYPYDTTDDHAWVEELRLSSIGSAPWQWTLGGFYRRYRDVASQPIGYGYWAGPLPAPFGGSEADTLYKSWSVFGDINYTWSERFTLGFGIRSFQEHQDFLDSVLTYDVGSTTMVQAGRFHSLDPRLYAQYKLSRDINIYASVAKGFRSGGFNADATLPLFAPEDVRTYELGTKMSVLEGRLRAETAIFYTDYKDYIVAGYVPGQLNPIIANAGNARLKGVEWDFVWRLSDQWSLGINGDYLDTRFTKINATSTAYEVGDPLDRVPKYQITSSVERDFIWSGKQGSMRLDYTRRGRETVRDRDLGSWYYGESDVINLLGYYMNLRWNESLSFNLFAQNLLNDRGLISPNIGTLVRSRPRTYGVGFRVSF